MTTWQTFLRSPKMVGGLGAAVLFAILGLIYWLLPAEVPTPPSGVPPANLQPDPPPPDPRLDPAVVFRNIRPEVQYVGDKACQDCHADISQTYQQHPMGRSATDRLALSLVERWEPPLTWTHGPYRLSIRSQASQRMHSVQP
ncbi:MAG: hypothetical protein N3E46_13930, partial [Gemmataceae bacterium]|nr:hypothetical protein [Gemmataceae bacterium]